MVSPGGKVDKGVRYALLASTADHGTRSISHAFERALQPERTMFMPRGFRRSGLRALFAGLWFVSRAEQAGLKVICLFNAPVILGAMVPYHKRGSSIGILDWTETYPSGRAGMTMDIYNWLYCRAFRRLPITASPVHGFRDFFGKMGVSVRNCMYPMPFPGNVGRPREPKSIIRLLYIGGDYKRKGGDLLLQMWAKARLKNAELTFVCPQPPIETLEGVRFLRDIRSGTPEHSKLLADHDILVLPTRQEPFGYVLLEAINSGLVCVTTEAAGAAEIVKDSGGLVAKDPESAVKSSFDLCAQPDLITAASRQACDFVPKYQAAFKQGMQNLFGTPVQYKTNK